MTYKIPQFATIENSFSHFYLHQTMLKNALFTACFLMGFTANAQTESKRAQKWQAAIDGLEKTEFVQKYTKAKEGIESQMTIFQRNKSTLNAADVEEVRKGYEATMANFDKLLDGLKADFMSKESRKLMIKFPDRYSKTFNAELEDNVRFYKNNCFVKMEALVPESGAFGLMEIQLFISLGGEVIKIIDKWQDKILKISGTYFEDHFVRNLRLKKWDAY
jgi:hypothetical protein